MSCNGNCNQGRTCDCGKRPKVDWLGVGFFASLILAVIYTAAFANYIWNMDKNRISYDCRLAEISVDYPVAVKEQCRKILNGRS
jgi:hypothetical protein